MARSASHVALEPTLDMSDLFRALFKALVSQVHPRMLWLAIWPFLAALFVCGGLAWWFRQEALTALGAVLNDMRLVGWLEAGFNFVGLDGFRVWLVPIVFIGLLIPTIVVAAVLIIALVAMPVILEHVASRDYADLARRRDASSYSLFITSLYNAAWVTVVFVIGWIATMPFWLIAPLALLLPLVWWGWLNARILRLDTLLEHASFAERSELLRRHRRTYLGLGILVSVLNFIPPLFLVAPVFAGLAFTHFNLHALRRLRAENPEPLVRPPIDMGAVQLIETSAAHSAEPPASSASSPPALPSNGSKS